MTTPETRINQLQCRCGKWFWRWSEDRTLCRLCDPDPIGGRVIERRLQGVLSTNNALVRARERR